MDVFRFFKRQIFPPPLRPHQLVAKQAGASILIVGDNTSEKVKTFLTESSTPFGTVAPVFVITTQPEIWVNRPQTMVLGIATRTASTTHYMKMVDILSESIKKYEDSQHLIVVIDNSEHLGKLLKEAVNKVKQPNVELIVFRDFLAKSFNDHANIRLFERVALFKNGHETLSFLKKYKNVQNTLIWFNAKDAKPGKYWIV